MGCSALRGVLRISGRSCTSSWNSSCLDIAAKLWQRLRERCRPLTPRRFLTLDAATLKRCGFTRQKIGYARGLAEAIIARRFSPARLAALDDDTALAALISLRGFRRWSADLRALGESWRRWRSVAACFLWQFYLCRLNRALLALPLGAGFTET